MGEAVKVAQPADDRLEQGSFRDRDSRVFYSAGAVFRGLSARGLEEWERLAATSFFPRLLEAGRIVGTERVSPERAPDPAVVGEWEATLKHEVVPFVSYPYEWSFGMMQDAALLQLELMATALEEDMVLKDATPYNVQWFGSRPTFIDIPSFVKQVPGEPWAGYKQFCELCLYPLFLQAYKDVPFHAWLRGNIDGITPEDFRGLMSLRDLIRPGVLLHVQLHAMMQTSHADADRDVRRDVRAAGFSKELIKANVKRLTKLVRKLRWKRAKSTWSDYATDNTYDEANRARKSDFVRQAVTDRPRKLVWDLGCNTGDYSRIAAETAEYVVAMDGDHLAVESLYQRLKNEQVENILPLLINLNSASPNLGWRGTERTSLEKRGTPDLTLALALIHHMVIAANIPLPEFVDYLASLGSDLVIEFVTKEDPMVKKLLMNKEDKYADYEISVFERCLADRFEIVRQEPLNDGLRVIYFARARG